jgi:hypothetical protein
MPSCPLRRGSKCGDKELQVRNVVTAGCTFRRAQEMLTCSHGDRDRDRCRKEEARESDEAKQYENKSLVAVPQKC